MVEILQFVFDSPAHYLGTLLLLLVILPWRQIKVVMRK